MPDQYVTEIKTLYYESSSISPFSASIFQAPKIVRENESFYFAYGLGTFAADAAPPISPEDEYPPNTPIFGMTPDESPKNVYLRMESLQFGKKDCSADGPPAQLIGAATTSIARGQVYVDTLSITRTGVYRLILEQSGTLATNTAKYPIVVLPATGTREVLISYTSASTIQTKEYFRNLMYGNVEVDISGHPTSITVQNVQSPITAPITANIISASYGCTTSVTGSLAGMFSGSIVGRIVGDIRGIVNNQYYTQYYADPFSGSFVGILTGSMCGTFNGSGTMTASAFDAGSPVASASINGNIYTAYSGTIIGGISGSIVGSSCCNISFESERLITHNFAKLADGRVRLNYSRKNPITQAYTMSIIETVPLI